jgi:hypothetical protein
MDLKWNNVKVAGMAGTLVAAVFAFYITGVDYFKAFIPAVLLIGLVSSIPGFLIKKSGSLWPAFGGGITALLCCLIVLFSAVSNI